MSQDATAGRQFLNADQLLTQGRKLRRIEEVPLPGFGPDAAVRVASMSQAAKDRFDLSLIVTTPDGKQREDRTNFRSKLLAACLVGEDGSPMFTERQVEQLAEVDGAALEPAVDAALRINGYTKEELESKVGNSASVQSDAS